MSLGIIKTKKRWYSVYPRFDKDGVCRSTTEQICKAAHDLHIKTGIYRIQDWEFLGVYATIEEVRALTKMLGRRNCSYNRMNKVHVSILESQLRITDEMFKRFTDK